MCQHKSEFFYTDINFVKTFIDTCAPKKWFYDYIIVVFVH